MRNRWPPLPVHMTATTAAGESLPRRSPSAEPSRLYRARLWRAGLWAARWLPRSLAARCGSALAASYCAVVRERREVVQANLLPVVDNDPARARDETRRLFRKFGAKIADLWCYESGQNVSSWFRELTGWEHFKAAESAGRGVLLVTVHLGNWEFGAPLLRDRGVDLQVLTLAEPDASLTALRQRSRQRRGVRTLVVGANDFGVIEVIRQLQAGATVALLMDRPPAPTAVSVELFGRRLSASISAAELARASGCVILPVYLPETAGTYAAHLLPAIPYARAELHNRTMRIALTQEIMRAFQPVIQKYVGQWYHFVPIWEK